MAIKRILIKKSQAWGIDLTVAVSIFLAGIVVFYFYAINFSSEAEEGIDALFNDGEIIADMLFSEGSPADWNSENVVSFGLASKGIINETKLERLYNIVNSDYNGSKKILKAKPDFYIYFNEKMNISGNITDGIGKPGVNRTNVAEMENPQSLVKIERITAYKGKPTQMNLYLWN